MKLQRLSAVLTVFVLLGAGEAEKPSGDAVKGFWATTSLSYNGKPVPIDPIVGPLVTAFDGASYLQKVGADIVEEGTYTINSAVSPATIDLIATSGPNAGKTQLGIYECTGDTLKLCLNLPGVSRRPKVFEGTGGQTLVVTRKFQAR